MAFHFLPRSKRRALFLCLSGGLLVFSFQNCSSPYTTLMTAESSQIIPTEKIEKPEMDKYLEKAPYVYGSGSSKRLKGQIGAYLWGGQLDEASSKGKPLLASSRMLGGVGFSALRVAMGENTDYALKFASDSDRPRQLIDWLNINEMKETLLDPAFPVVAITPTDYALGGKVTKISLLDDEIKKNQIFNEYFIFFSGLYALPVTQPKTFIISNWEGDNQIFYCPGLAAGGKKAVWIEACDQQIRTDLGQSLNDSIDGFYKWNLLRKAALLAAQDKFANSSQVEIKFAIEFNQIDMISRALSRSVLWDLIPGLKPDLVLYSSYESIERNTLAADLSRVRAFLDEKGLRETDIGIGEMGTTGTRAHQQTVLRRTLKDLALHFPELAIGFIWNAFNAQNIDDGSAYSMGLWQPNGALHVAPSPGLLVPILDPIADVEGSCFERAGKVDCEWPITGMFPQFALNEQSGLLRCQKLGSTSIRLEVAIRYDTAKLQTVVLPAVVRGWECQLQVRSDLGIPSAWSSPFQVGVNAASSVTPPIAAMPEGYDIILIGGQSNSSNGGIGTFVDPLAEVNDDRIFQLACGDANQVIQDMNFLHDCKFMENPLNYNFIVSRQQRGFGISFARQYVNQIPAGRKVLIIAGGVSGEGSLNWDPGQPHFELLMARAKAALNLPGQNRVVAFLWSLGEADIQSVSIDLGKNLLSRASSDEFIHDYGTRLKRIISGSRSVLNLPKLPFIMTEKSESWTAHQQTKLRYQDMDRWVASTVGFASLVSTAGIKGNAQCADPDGAVICEDAGYIHFSAQGQVNLGIRLYQEFALKFKY